MLFHDVLSNILQTIGEGYALQKQDILCRQAYHHDVPDYDLFLTLSDAALCFFFKEHLKESEETPLTTYYTDRQGLPVCIDITGKEGKKKMTDNANMYCFLVTDCGWKPDYIWEILNSNVKNEIAERVINKWNQGYAG